MDMTEIYLTKRAKVVLDDKASVYNSLREAVTVVRNFEALGFTVTRELFEALRRSSPDQIIEFYTRVVPILKKMVGAHRVHDPFYPNFPQQVIDASDAELYYNAIIHYWGFALQDAGVIEAAFRPEFEKDERFPLSEFTKLKPIDLGTPEDFFGIFTSLMAANSSLSSTDKEIVEWFIQDYISATIIRLLPDTIQQKETLALLVGNLLKRPDTSPAIADNLFKYIKTSTDVLRIVTVMSGGDVSLAQNTKFRKFSRRERRFFLAALEQSGNITEDMLRHKDRWIRVGEILHPGEFSKRFPKTYAAFNVLRNDAPFASFNSCIETGLQKKIDTNFLDQISSRPGDFARRLDHILRQASSHYPVTSAFLKVADKVSTPVLLQCYAHFKDRTVDNRAFFPKGNIGKMQVSEKELPELPGIVTRRLAEDIRGVLVNRFSKLPPLGNVYIDPALTDCPVPFAMRSASKALKTVARGTKMVVPDANTIRLFLWWKNGDSRVDIDLSCVFFDSKWEKMNSVGFYRLHLPDSGIYHSGDITNAPNGAAEFIDVEVEKFRKQYRYLVMTIHSYSKQAFVDLPECFAGWMGRQSPKSGEIFEPRTVQDKIDLTSDTQGCIPIIFDTYENKMIWTDIPLKGRTALSNSARIAQFGRAMINLNKPTLADLFGMHADGRGKLTERDDAGVVFSAHEGVTPFDIDTILAEYLQ